MQLKRKNVKNILVNIIVVVHKPFNMILDRVYISKLTDNRKSLRYEIIASNLRQAI